MSDLTPGQSQGDVMSPELEFKSDDRARAMANFIGEPDCGLLMCLQMVEYEGPIDYLVKEWNVFVHDGSEYKMTDIQEVLGLYYPPERFASFYLHPGSSNLLVTLGHRRENESLRRWVQSFVCIPDECIAKHVAGTPFPSPDDPVFETWLQTLRDCGHLVIVEEENFSWGDFVAHLREHWMHNSNRIFSSISRSAFLAGAADVIVPNRKDYLMAANARLMVMFADLHIVMLGLMLEMVRRSMDVDGLSWDDVDRASKNVNFYCGESTVVHSLSGVVHRFGPLSRPSEIFEKAKAVFDNVMRERPSLWCGFPKELWTEEGSRWWRL